MGSKDKPEREKCGEPFGLVIHSGGQTGADRAALDAGLDAGCACAGWCPQGRMAEDGAISERYPLQVLPGSDYRDRTLANVRDTDGTVIFYNRAPSGGTALTLRFCVEKEKPYLLIDTAALTTAGATDQLREFVASHDISNLNIAGPRHSNEPAMYPYVYETIKRLLRER